MRTPRSSRRPQPWPTPCAAAQGSAAIVKTGALPPPPLPSPPPSPPPAFFSAWIFSFAASGVVGQSLLQPVAPPIFFSSPLSPKHSSFVLPSSALRQHGSDFVGDAVTGIAGGVQGVLKWADG